MAKEGRMNYREIFGILWRNASFMKGRRALYLVGGVLSLGRLAMSFLIPYLYKSLIQLVESGTTPPEALSQLGIPFFLLIIVAPLVCLGGYWQKLGAYHASASMQKHVFRHVVHLPLSSLEHGRADKLMRATENAQSAAHIFSGTFMMLMKFIIFGVGALILLLAADVRFALMGIAFSACTFIMSTALNIRLRVLERSALEAESTAAAHLMELVMNLPVVKLYLLESHLSDKFYSSGAQAYSSRLSYKRLRGVTDGVMDFTSYIVQSFAIMLGVGLLSGEGFRFANLVYIAGLLDVMLTGMREFGFFIQFIQKGIVNSQRMYELLAEPSEADRDSLVRVNLTDALAAEFKNVSFSYGDDKLTLQNINLQIPKGKMTAIVGPSGCGKSTLIKLMEGFYAPDSGQIRIFGAPIDQLSNRDIREIFAYIPQDAGLFDGTIVENICLGNPNCGEEEIQAAIKRAALEEYIAAMPEKENTSVGENGSQISGGQRQRIAIARALLKDAPIYLLDEATSALDVNTERAIQAAFREILAGKTVICVAHRLSTIVNADHIIYMEEGQIKEMGTHEELMHRKGGYYKLYSLNEQS